MLINYYAYNIYKNSFSKNLKMNSITPRSTLKFADQIKEISTLWVTIIYVIIYNQMSNLI